MKAPVTAHNKRRAESNESLHARSLRSFLPFIPSGTQGQGGAAHNEWVLSPQLTQENPSQTSAEALSQVLLDWFLLFGDGIALSVQHALPP